MEIFKNVLVPVDFSEGSESAFKLALFFGKGKGAKIYLTHIISDPQITDPLYTANIYPKIYFDDIKRELEEKIRNMYAPRIDGVGEIDVIVTQGYPSSEISILTEKLDIDLVVMGTHGRHGFSHMLLGSVAEKVIRESKVPVLTVKLDHKIAVESYNINNILVPVDFSEMSEKAFDVALKIGSFFNSEITVLFVNQPVSYYPYYLSDYYSEESLIEKIDEQVVTKLAVLVKGRGAGYRNINTVIKRGDPHQKINEVADETGSNMIIMGTHGRKGLAHMVMGSVAERVVRTSHIPVMTVRG